MSVWAEKLAAAVSGRSRRRKFDDFLTRLRPAPGDRILDVGVNDREYSPSDNHLEKFYPHPEAIVALAQAAPTLFARRYPGIACLAGDGLHLPFPDRSFAIVHANAVIEHVGGRANQVRFLEELLRVGRRGYVTTPSRHFPIEVHTRVPLLHLVLSKARFDRFVTWLGKGWAAGDYMHLLGRRDLETILAEAGIRDYTVTTSRLAGFPMTYTVVWENAAAAPPRNGPAPREAGPST